MHGAMRLPRAAADAFMELSALSFRRARRLSDKCALCCRHVPVEGKRGGGLYLVTAGRFFC